MWWNFSRTSEEQITIKNLTPSSQIYYKRMTSSLSERSCLWMTCCLSHWAMTWPAGRTSWPRWTTPECNSRCLVGFLFTLLLWPHLLCVCNSLPGYNSVKSPWITLSLAWEKSEKQAWWSRYSDVCFWFTSPSDHEQLLLLSIKDGAVKCCNVYILSVVLRI